MLYYSPFPSLHRSMMMILLAPTIHFLINFSHTHTYTQQICRLPYTQILTKGQWWKNMRKNSHLNFDRFTSNRLRRNLMKVCVSYQNICCALKFNDKNLFKWIRTYFSSCSKKKNPTANTMTNFQFKCAAIVWKLVVHSKWAFNQVCCSNNGTGIKSQNEKCSEFVIILRKQIAVCSPLKINVK